MRRVVQSQDRTAIGLIDAIHEVWWDHIGLPDPELWPKLGDGDVREAAYRGGWKPA